MASILIIIAGFTAIAEEKPLKVFVLAGQSNMFGAGANIEDLPEELQKPQKDVLVFQKDAWIPLDPGKATDTGKHFGPEVTFGQIMTKELGEPIGIIKLSVGGTNLAVEWNPDNQKLLSLYSKLVKIVKEAQKSRPIVICGMLWMQGERDSKFEDMAKDYQKNLPHLIESARKDFGVKDMPFACGRVNSNKDFVDLVRKAQESCDLPGYKMVDCDDLAKISDHLHYSSKGQMELGKKFAAAMLELMKADKSQKKAP